jgi:hypothetical protein
MIINWGKIWGNLKKITYIKSKISEFQWKSIHNIIYTECRLKRMGLSQVKGCCHFGKHPPETQQHLFYNCKITFPLIQCIQTLFFEEDNITFDQHSMILGYDKGTEKGVILGNILIYVAKWTIWKQRNKSHSQTKN